MNYIREAENILRYYRDLQASIGNMDREIKKLTWRTAPKDANAVSYDEAGVSSRRVDNTYNDLIALQTLVQNKRQTEEELEKIHTILEELEVDPDCQNFGKVLRMWYIEKIKIADMAHRLNYSQSTLYEVRNRAIRKFAVRMFGFDALKVI